MADSLLDPDNDPMPDRQLGKGHGVDALGPSGTSDSGSDIVGNDGLAVDDEGLGLDTQMVGQDDDLQRGTGAGADVGDANLDSDSDEGGTGERAAAGRDSSAVPGADISVDRVVSGNEIGVAGGLDEAELAEIDPVGSKPRQPKQDR